ncbi:MAG TPA: hypothetical protein VHH35_09540, partial [Pyrinomonadaceae bacterium]|nr:hypothetical protein [Pyrinomonadaceae bacterium]
MDDELKDESRKGDDWRVPTAEERLSRLIGKPGTPETSPLGATRHDPETKKPLAPGVVHVVLKEGIDGHRVAKRLADGKDDAELGHNLSDLRRILLEHEALDVKPTFDFTPPGLAAEANPPQGRER